LEEFFRVCGDQAWLPFSDDPRDVCAIEERRLFHEMKEKYYRHAAPSSTNGYNGFRDEWCREAGRRHFEKLRGNDNEIFIHHKSVKQLQEYYDKCEERQTTAVTENPFVKRKRDELATDVRNARARVHLQPVLPRMPIIHPVHYPPTVPFGDPMTLNAQIVTQGVEPRVSDSGRAPFQMPAPAAVPPSAVRQLPTGVSFKHICSNCGRLKRYHAGVRCTDFGTKCTFADCGHCGILLSKHAQYGSMTGFFCRLTASQGANELTMRSYELEITQASKT
jgi:hypothetical protein